MSKYTTEIRFICEKEAGYDESRGYSDVDKIIRDSRSKIFNFEYPIFDEAYRPVLETKILRHYYTREIGVESYGLWKLRLQTLMNEIMPLYNQFYESELIKFNPLYDVDLKTQHQGEKYGQENDKENSVSIYNDTVQHDENYSVNKSANSIDINNKQSENAENGVRVTNKDETDNRDRSADINKTNTENENTTHNASGTKELNENDNRITNANSDSMNTENENTKREKSENANENETSNSTKINAISSDKTHESKQSDSNTESSNKNGIVATETKEAGSANKHSDSVDATNENQGDLNYDLYSDTPQGGLTGVDNETYLTNARKITDTKNRNSDSVNNSNEFDSHSAESSGSSVSNEAGSVTKVGVTENAENNSEKNSNLETGADNSEKNSAVSGEESANRSTVKGENANENKVEIGSANKAETDSRQDDENRNRINAELEKHNESEIGFATATGTEADNRNKTEKESAQNIGSSTSTETNAGNKRTDNEGNKLDNRNRENTMTSTEAYTLHVIGKQAGASFSKMLKEFRDTFLNIDLEIIRELSPLFMNIW